MYLFRKKLYKTLFFSIQKLKLHVEMKKMSSPTAVDVYVISLEEGIAQLTRTTTRRHEELLG